MLMTALKCNYIKVSTGVKGHIQVLSGSVRLEGERHLLKTHNYTKTQLQRLQDVKTARDLRYIHTHINSIYVDREVEQ